MTASLATDVDLLLIEDSEDDILLAEEALSGSRLRLTSIARDGEEGLAMLRARSANPPSRPLLVWLDLNLPGRNGIEILQTMKADASLRSLPVVILTTSDNPSDVQRAYDAGASSYVRKPVDFQAFRDVVRGMETYWLQIAMLPRPA